MSARNVEMLSADMGIKLSYLEPDVRLIRTCFLHQGYDRDARILIGDSEGL